MVARLFAFVLIILLVIIGGILIGVDRDNKKLWTISLIALILAFIALAVGWWMIPTDW